MGVIEGDIQSTRDAERISEKGIPAVQINTDGACHLDGNMIRDALPSFDLTQLDLLVVENVGNLVCPAEFNVGEDHKVMILSVAEGADKPEKYPLMFHESSVLLKIEERIMDEQTYSESFRFDTHFLMIWPHRCRCDNEITWHWSSNRIKDTRRVAH